MCDIIVLPKFIESYFKEKSMKNLKKILMALLLVALMVSAVATVAIDGAANAALLAVEMLALSDDGLYDKLVAARKAGEETVLQKNKAIEERFNA